MYLGEFGVFDKAPLEDRIKCTSAVARVAEIAVGLSVTGSSTATSSRMTLTKDAWNEAIRGALVRD